MKVFKKLFAVIVAFVMAFALFVFAACDDEDSGKDNQQGSENTGNESGSGSGSGNDSEGSGNDSEGSGAGDEGSEGNESGTNGDVLKEVMKGTFLQELTTLNIQILDSSVSDEDVTSKPVATVSIDLTNGNADIESVVREWEEGDGELVFLGYDYTYYFIRGWELFSYSEYDENTLRGKEVTDFTGKTFTYEGNVFDSLTSEMFSEDENASQAVAIAAYVNLALEYVPRTNYSILALAKAADSVTVEGNEITVDVIKLAYNTVQNVKELVKGLDEKTTVGDILQNEGVKAYGMAFTELVTPDEVESLIGLLVGMIGSQNPADDSASSPDISAILSLILPKAEECETTYEYLYKVLSSKELCALAKAALAMLDEDTLEMVSAMLEEMADMEIPAEMLGAIVAMVDSILPEDGALTDINLSEVLKNFDMTIDGVKTIATTYIGMLDSIITEEAIIIPVFDSNDGPSDGGYEQYPEKSNGVAVLDEEDEAEYTILSSLKIVYTVNAEYEIISQSVEILGNDVAGDKFDSTINMTYAPADFAVLDIDENEVVKTEESIIGASGETKFNGTNITFTVESVSYSEGDEPEVSLIVSVGDEVLTPSEEGVYTYNTTSIDYAITGYGSTDNVLNQIVISMHYAYDRVEGNLTVRINSDEIVIGNTVSGILNGNDWQAASAQ